ncbi:MAG: glycerophosphodiester phosphodiesterase [Acidobacteria bacterium]|nr:glycerophosphodiester phosphodiesterase [Acidobacteriota bacterium]
MKRPHPFRSSARPLVFAHRGGCALAPENTLPAFDQALSLGVDGLELDIQLSRDGVVVVCHDVRLDRTTNARGLVRELTADELARVDAACRFGGEAAHPWRGTLVGIPRLGEVLRRYRECWIIVEMKENDPRLAHAVADEIRRADAVERVCVGGFGLRGVLAARRYAPEIATSAGKAEVRWALYRSWVGVPLLSPPYVGYQVPEWSGTTRIISSRFIRYAHRHDLFVQAWTIDRLEDMRRLIEWGIDGLITDRPDLAVPLVKGPAEARLKPGTTTDDNYDS